MSQQARSAYEVQLHTAANEYLLYRREEGLYPMIKLLGLPVPSTSQRIGAFEEDLDDLRRVFNHLSGMTPILPREVQNGIKLPKDLLKYLPEQKDLVAGVNYIPVIYESWKKDKFQTKLAEVKKNKNFKRREARRQKKKLLQEQVLEEEVGGPQSMTEALRTLPQDYPELGVSLSYAPKPITPKTVLAAKAALVKFESGDSPVPNYLKLLRQNRSRLPLRDSFSKWSENSEWRLGLKQTEKNLSVHAARSKEILTSRPVMLERLFTPCSKPMQKWKARYIQARTDAYNRDHPLDEDDDSS